VHRESSSPRLSLYEEQSHADGLLQSHDRGRQPGGRPGEDLLILSEALLLEEIKTYCRVVTAIRCTIASQEEIDALYSVAEDQVVEIGE